MFSKTSFPLVTASPLPPFTSSSCLAFFASSFQGLCSSEISVTQFDEEAPSVGFLLAIMETEEPPPLGVKPEVEASSATFPVV
uniref:Uncharacterized protein n=1 Tax=Gorilla gorilla gorilla TaxID=9595 RepID=A0A2I2YVK9_GORGO